MKIVFFLLVVVAVIVVYFNFRPSHSQSDADQGNPPVQFAEWLTGDAGEASGILKKHSFPNATNILIKGIAHPQFGRTFIVNIDRNRSIIKLKPVRDTREGFFFYDPFSQGSHGMEVNSRYEQSRCECGGYRWKLSAGFVYFNGQQGDNYSGWLLAGHCTECNSENILFQNS